METKTITFVSVLIITFGCGKQNSDNKLPKPQLTAESIITADSLQKLANMHRYFVGTHKHNTSLKNHAHQDPSKKIRVFRKQRENADMLRKGMQKANNSREQRIKKILEEKNK